MTADQLAGDSLLRLGAGYPRRGGCRGGHAQTIYASFFAPRPAVALPPRALGNAGRRFHRTRLVVEIGRSTRPVSTNAPRAARSGSSAAEPSHRERPTRCTVPRAGGKLTQSLRAGTHGGREGCRLARRRGPLSQLRRRTQPAAALLSFRRLRGDRLDQCGGCAAKPCARYSPRAFRSAATRCSSGLGETGASAGTIVKRAAAVSAPVDLMAAGDALGQGFNLSLRTPFPRHPESQGAREAAQHPGLFDAARVRSARTLREFDDVVTAPLHGFTGVDDYWTRASSKPWLSRIAVPTLMINARNDPFLPCSALPAPHEVAPAVTLEQPEAGGHVGFVSGTFPGNLGWMPRRILNFLGAIFSAPLASRDR